MGKNKKERNKKPLAHQAKEGSLPNVELRVHVSCTFVL